MIKNAPPPRCIFLLRLSAFYIWPAEAIPLYLLHHQRALVGLDVAVVAVVEDVVASILREYLATMTWAIEVVSLFASDDRCSVTFGHRVAIAVAECACQTTTTAYDQLVGVVLVPTRTREEIPISVAAV